MIVGGRAKNSNNWVLIGAIAVLVVGVLLIALMCGGGGDDGARAEEPSPTPTRQVAGVATPAPSPSPQPTPTPAVPPSGSTYVIVSGDTLFDLAVKWNTTVDAIVGANNIEDPADLSIGQEIKVP